MTEPSRWGRTTFDLPHSSNRLEFLRVSVVAINGLAFNLFTPHARMMAGIIAGMGDFEREPIRERIRSGIAAATARSKRLGRNRAPTKIGRACIEGPWCGRRGAAEQDHRRGHREARPFSGREQHAELNKVAISYFVTHPEVAIDPSVPVPEWPLSSQGIRRVMLMLDQAWVGRVRAVFTSPERKALDAACILSDHLSLSPIVITDLGENDRSATGYLPKAEFEAVADEFFAHPYDSVRGWERAIDAQRRIVQAMDRIIAMAPAHGDMAIISHGGVGTLLLCYLKSVPISRTEDQPNGGGGNAFSFDIATRRPLTGWHRIDE